MARFVLCYRFPNLRQAGRQRPNAALSFCLVRKCILTCCASPVLYICISIAPPGAVVSPETVSHSRSRNHTVRDDARLTYTSPVRWRAKTTRPLVGRNLRAGAEQLRCQNASDTETPVLMRGASMVVPMCLSTRLERKRRTRNMLKRFVCHLDGDKMSCPQRRASICS